MSTRDHRSQRARQAGLPRKSGRPKTDLLLKQKRNRTSVKGKRVTNGRPQKWNRGKVFPYICERMSKGDLIADICKSIGISHVTVLQWIAVDLTGELRKRWNDAKLAQAHALAARAIRITTGRDGRGKAIKRHKKILEKTKDPRLAEKVKQLEMGRIQRNRLELDGLKWYTRVVSPREFGDKVDVTSDGAPLPSAAPQHLIVKFVQPGEKVE